MTRAFSAAFAAGFTGIWLLAALAWWWLSLAERNWRDLALTALLGAVIVALAVFLVAAAFSRGAPAPRLPRAALFVLPLAAGTAALLAWKPSWWTVAVLGFTLPPLLHWACGGRPWLATVARPRYWLAAAAWLGAGLYAPWRLIWWIPTLQGLQAQSISAALRILLATLLFTGVSVWFAADLWRTDAPPAAR